MPIMPRTSKKLEKLAYKILGEPDNLKKRNQTKKEKEEETRLDFEESVRQR